MVLAALVMGGRMFFDLSKEMRGSENVVAVLNPAASNPVGGQTDATTEPETPDQNTDEELLKRIDEILNPQRNSSTDLQKDTQLLASAVNPDRSDAVVPAAETVEQPLPAKSTKKSADPIRQQTPLHADMLTPGNFVYMGGFRPEFGDGLASRFGLGGWAIAFRPDGDPNGKDDGFPGSIYMVGHRHEQLVAEINIPKPFVSLSKNINDLPEAKILQPFADITGGLRTRMTNGSSEPFEIGGMFVAGNRLQWTMYKYYNVEQIDYLSHGLSSLDLSSRAVRGMWHLGPQNSNNPAWHSYKHAGYICDVPQDLADKYLGGRNLMSGLQISTGRQTSSQGPALFAYKIDDENLPAGSSLDAIPLLWYPMNAEMAGHHPTDSWQGAAWLTAGNKQAIIVVGRKGLGPVHYGESRPGECYQYKGYHASAYETQMLFYRPEDVLAGARNHVPDTPTAYRWDANTPGGNLDRFTFQTCRKDIGGMALDRTNNLLYIVEVNAGLSDANEWEEIPVIHVLKVVP